MAHVYAALVGNGLSIPYNASLAVPALTADLLSTLSNLSGSPAGAALAAFAKIRGTSAPSNPSKNFELLLGPLEAAAEAIPHLAALAGLASGASIVPPAAAIVSAFATVVHRIGLGAVLDRIASHSRANLNSAPFTSTIRAWLDAWAKLLSVQPLTIGTLNYDGLLHAAALLSPSIPISDLATGYAPGTFSVTASSGALPADRLRDTDDLPAATVEILNLHGYLGWLRDSSGVVWKFRLDDLRGVNYWGAFAAGSSTWAPVVILTDQKTVAVAQRPFSLAYEAFRVRLAKADRWMIVGYGLGDTPVNEVLRSAAASKSTSDLNNLKVLVIDYKKVPAALQQQVAQIVGVPPGQVTSDVTGIPSAIGVSPWQTWAV